MKEKFMISLLSQLSSSIIHLLSFYFLFSKINADLLGLWVFLTSFVNLGFIFVDIGLDQIHYQYSGKSNISDYFGTFFIIKFFLILINVIITLILAGFLNLWDSYYFLYIIILLFSKIIFETSNIFMVNLKSKLKLFKAELPSFFITFGKSIAIIVLAFNITVISNPILYLSFSMFIFDILFLLIVIWISIKDFKINKPKREYAIRYLNDVKHLLVFSIFFVIATNLGNLILDYSFGHESLGYVGLISVYIIPLFLVISRSIVGVYLPLFAHFFEKKDIESIKHILYTIEKYSSIIFLSIIILTLLNGELMISIFMPNFSNSYSILIIMIFIPYLIGITQPYSYLLIAGKKQKHVAYINTFIRIIIMLLMIILIPNSMGIFLFLGLGDFGYAISQTLPWILWFFLSHYYVYKNFKIKSQMNIYFHIPIAFLSLFLSLILKNFIFIIIIESRLVLLSISSIILILSFFGLLILFKQINKRDLKFIFQIFKIYKYKESFKAEFN